MKTEHKYAQVLRWIADGETFQCVTTEGYLDCDSGFVIRLIASGNSAPPDKFRLKPRTITVNGREIVAGEDSPPTGEFFFTDIESVDCFGSTVWGGTRLDKLRLERGLVHLTKENAIAHAKAMLGID